MYVTYCTYVRGAYDTGTVPSYFAHARVRAPPTGSGTSDASEPESVLSPVGLTIPSLVSERRLVEALFNQTTAIT